MLPLLFLAGFLVRTRWQWAPLMVISALLSHHLRDSFRRGLWLWPLSDTSIPVSYLAYLVLEMLMVPLLCGLFSLKWSTCGRAKMELVEANVTTL